MYQMKGSTYTPTPSSPPLVGAYYGTLLKLSFTEERIINLFEVDTLQLTTLGYTVNVPLARLKIQLYNTEWRVHGGRALLQGA